MHGWDGAWTPLRAVYHTRYKVANDGPGQAISRPADDLDKVRFEKNPGSDIPG